MHFQEIPQALNFTLCSFPERRRCSRVHLPIRATVAFPNAGIQPQNALLRNINTLGAFFYCQQRPGIGHNVTLNFDLPEQGEQVIVVCEGHVVRIEEFIPGAAIGVAMEFTRYELARPVKAEQPRQPENAPFIGWTIGMVERTITKATSSTRTNSKWEGAA